MRGGGVSRWIWVVIGLAMIWGALDAAAEPYRQTVEFRRVTACDGTVGGCLEREPGSIVGTRTWTETTTSTNADGTSSTSTTTYYEATWRRLDGSEETRDVSSDFFAVAHGGEPATLRLHRGEVVGVEVAGGAEWFLPRAGKTLLFWLLVAFLGLGFVLWGLIFGEWDGCFMLAFRAFGWLTIGFVVVKAVTYSVAYETFPNLSAGDVLGGLFVIGVAGAMLVCSLEFWD
jgi:hypothetical protein